MFGVTPLSLYLFSKPSTEISMLNDEPKGDFEPCEGELLYHESKIRS
jgi:hypothetical protein